MIEALPVALAQLLFGLVIACIIFALGYLAWEKHKRQQETRLSEHWAWRLSRFGVLTPNEARMCTPGAWQYADDFFDKIEEFRSDFA